MTARDRVTVMRDLDAARRRLASNRKTAELTDKPATAVLCDKLAASLRRQIADLETELLTAPEPPTRAQRQGFTIPEGCTLDRGFAYAPSITAAQCAELEIPAFLRRAS
jgi:hypothetical protein